MMRQIAWQRRALTVALCLLCAATLALPSPAAAQRKGRLAGKVLDMITGKPIEGALVAIQGTTTSTLTDKDGEFHFDVPEGTYSITIFKDEFFSTCYQDIFVKGGRITTYKCDMVYGDPKQNIFFSIGGINVIDQRELLPEDIETTHSISSAEIEHQLSTNLGDILDLVPGVERTAPPGLSKKTQVGLRGTSDMASSQEEQLALFGTKVLVDDIAISNNANLQRGTGTTYGGTSTTVGSQIDLRTIPADNIQNVKVITGVPSVEYGDLTTGLVKVSTKSGRQPNRLKLKSNPDTKEGNLNGGFILKGTGLTYNLNAAYSERDIRREGDEYIRYNGQLTFRNQFLGDRMNVLNKFYYTGTRDEQDTQVDDPLSIEQYNRDKTYVYGHSIDYKPTADTKLEWTANVNYTDRNSYYQKLVGADVRILTDATEPGTYPGVFGAGAYLSRIWTKGKEWNVGAKLNFRWNFTTSRFDHALLTGGEYTFDGNRGEGKIFDPLWPPNGNPGQRPLPYDASPDLQTASFYIEDEISGSLRFRPWSLNLGFRYEMYNPVELNLGGLFNDEGVVKSKNGTYLNPRVRFKYQPLKDTQVRLSWGKSSKMPSLSSIFQGPEYIDIVEENVSPPDSIPLISTYVFNYDNSWLTGYDNQKFEASLDQKIGPVGVTLTGYYTDSHEMPRGINTPLTLYRYRWTGWPDQNDPNARTVIDTIHTEAGTSFGYYGHVGWYKNYGFEFSLVTKRIEKLSTVFHITGSFYRNHSGADGTYLADARLNQTLGQTIYPIYYYTEGWYQKMIVNYSADWFIKPLGMWVTFFVQQTMFDKNKSLVDPIPYATGYYDPVAGRTVSITPEESAALGLDRSYDDYDLSVRSRPNDRLLFNINVSKSIGSSAEISMFVHNVLDDPAYYLDELGYYRSRNYDIFYGVEFSMILDELWRALRPGGGEEL
jgi:hypothetical protein